MDEHLLRVGDFLRRTRLSPKALRLYGDRGLLAPARVDGHTGYRWYTPAQVARARLVGLLRQAGMPLARVREVVDLEPADRWPQSTAGGAASRRTSRAGGRSSAPWTADSPATTIPRRPPCTTSHCAPPTSSRC